VVLLSPSRKISLEEFKLKLTTAFFLAVGIATDWMVVVQFLAEVRFFSSPQRSDRLWGPPSLLSNGAIYPGIK
jgi:hypothetical protein